MVDRQLADRCAALLRELIALDTQAVTLLCKARVRCNEALAEHPAVQVGGAVGAGEVGLLGVLNGLCGVYDDGPRKGWGAVAVIFDEDGTAIDAKVLDNAEIET